VLATGHLFLGKQSSYTSGKPSAGITGKPGGPLAPGSVTGNCWPA